MDPYTATILLMTEVVKAYNGESPGTRDAQGAALQRTLDDIADGADKALKLLNIPLTVPRLVVYLAPKAA